MNCNERLPYAALGFSSVETFVLHLTEDVLTVKFTADDLKLFPIMPPQSVCAQWSVGRVPGGGGQRALRTPPAGRCPSLVVCCSLGYWLRIRKVLHVSLYF